MERFIMQLLACAAEMSIVSLVYIGLLSLLKNRQQPVVRYYVWIALLIGFLTPFKPSFGSGAVTIPAPEQAAVTATNVPVQSSSFNIWNIVFIVWVVGSVISLVHFAVRYKAFCKSIRRLSRSVGRDTQILADDIATSMGIWSEFRVVVVKGLVSPMMTGLFKPTVLLPEREFSKAELRLVIRHELTHFKHKDLWFKLLVVLCRAVYWFDPIMLLIDRCIDRECEYFCDSSVMKGENAEVRKRYCASILDTVSAQSRQSGNSSLRPVMATNFCVSKKGLKHRLGLILSKRAKKKYLAVCAAAVALTAVSGSLIAFADHKQAEQPDPQPVNAQVTTVSSPRVPEQTYAQTTRKTSEQPSETTVTYAQTTRKAAETTTVTYEVTTALVRTEQQQSSPVTWEAETTVTAE
ncbi:MAG: M56 family metallopeptidase [Ruminococcus sp.]|nr:M56 family metallopeptidase [Ruminococcus sp.]